METVDQLFAIRKVLEKKFDKFYDQKFVFRLMAVTGSEKEYYQKYLAIMDALFSLVETNLMYADCRRAVHYLCILGRTIEELVERVDMEYRSVVEKQLVGM